MRDDLVALKSVRRLLRQRWLLGFGLLVLCVWIQAAWPDLGSGLAQRLVETSSRMASRWLDAAGVNHLLDDGEILLPGQSFAAKKLQQNLTPWTLVLAFTVAYLIIARRRLFRSLWLLASVPIWCVLVGAATVFVFVMLAGSPLMAALGSMAWAHALFIMAAILSCDQLLHVLWFARGFLAYLVVRVSRIVMGTCMLAYAQFLRLGRSQQGRRKQARWAVRARAMFRSPGSNFGSAKKPQRSSRSSRSRHRHRRFASESSHDFLAPVRRALQRRPALRIPLSLPAVGLLVAVVLAESGWSESGEALLTPRYLQAAESAFEEEDFAAAGLYYRKLEQLDGDSVAAIYGQARVADRQGDQARARKLMEEIAPEDTAGYPPAHVWLAKSLAEDRPSLDQDTASTYQLHLSQAVAGDPENLEAQALLGLFLHAVERHGEAIAHLKAAVDQRPDVWLPLAQSYANLPSLDEAKDAGEKAAAYYERMANEEPDLAQHRIHWANALVFLARFEEAESVLKGGFSGEPVEPFRTALAQTYVGWFDFLEGQPDRDVAMLLDIGQRGLTVATDDGPLLKRVARLAVFGGADSAQVATLRPLLQQAMASPDALVALGTEFIARGQFDRAVDLLERAYTIDSKSVEILNNLAWALVFASKPQLERALKLIDEAKRQYPDNPNICDTRGQILVRMGRFREALVDLELALPSLGRDPVLHQALAIAYANLGMPDLAGRHEVLAKPQS